MRRDDLLRSTPFSSIADALESDWRSIARPEQLPPDDAEMVLMLSGRGWGKTRSGSEWVRSLAEAGRATRIALVGPTAADCRDTMVEGESGLLAIAPNSNRPIYEPSKRRLTWPNGVQAAMFSSEEPERLRGPTFSASWCDEIGAWRNAQATWDNLQMTMRLGTRPRQLITSTPKPIKILRDLLKRKDVFVIRGRTQDNAENLAPTFLTQIVSRYAGTRLGRQELDAEMLEDTPGALWTLSLIEEGRVAKADLPPLKRIVVAIDPAVSVSESSDETGIIVAGLGADDHGYVLEDASGKFTPIEWARRAVSLYNRWHADRIVAEKNQGGEMVEQTVRTVDQNVSFKAVHASKGKITRAEPIAALAEQRRIHHVGTFPELEDQLCSFAAGSSDSPDRLDAMVWGMTELMLDGNGQSGANWLGYMRGQVEALDAPERPSPPANLPSTPFVTLKVPPGCGSVSGLSGMEYRPDAAGLIVVPLNDALPLLRAGFIQVEVEKC